MREERGRLGCSAGQGVRDGSLPPLPPTTREAGRWPRSPFLSHSVRSVTSARVNALSNPSPRPPP